MSLLDSALAYARKGRKVFPLKPRDKTPLAGGHGVLDATTDEAQITQWWTTNPAANIGLATGVANGIIVVDEDPRNGGSADDFPDTLVVSTGGGRHFYYSIDRAIRGTVIRPGIDLKADGGYVVAPPSIHPNGNTYAIIHQRPMAPFPENLFQKAPPDLQAATGGPDKESVPQGTRNSFLASLGGSMRAKGCSYETIHAALQAENTARCSPPLSFVEVERIAKSAARYSTALSLSLVRASTVQPESVEWIWKNWIPSGKVSILDGDPGVGKSTLAAAVVAGVTTGSHWFGQTHVGSAIVASAEDGYADTLVPRLQAAGADLSKVLFLAGLDLSKWQHEAALEKEASSQSVRIIVVDPFMAFLGYVDSYRDQAIRQVMSRLSRLGEETGAAILLIRHLNKNTETSNIYRGGGSIGITAAARSVLLLRKSEDGDEQMRVLESVKMNLCRRPDKVLLEMTGDPARVGLWTIAPEEQWTDASSP